MSLDISFMYPIDTYKDTDIEYIDIDKVWHDNEVDSHLNITHNLGEMASYVKSGELITSPTLYDLLWRPYRLYNIEEDSNESYNFMPKASELETAIEVALQNLIDNKRNLVKYESSNGWGTYAGLLEFTKKYLRCIKRYPNAKIYISR